MEAAQAGWGVVIVAAGRGTRMGTSESKQYLQLKDKPIVVHTLELFERMDEVVEIALVVGAQDVARCEAFVQQYHLSKVRAVLAGGTSASILYGSDCMQRLVTGS